MTKTTRNVFDSVCGLAAIISIALACCKGCDNQKLAKENAVVESQLQEKRDSVVVLQDSLKNVSGCLQEKKDSIIVLQDSLKNVSGRLTDCEKGKRCPVKKKPAKKPVKKPAPVVAKPDTIKPAPVVVKPDTIKPAPVVVKPDTIKTASVVVNNNSGNNVVNINNGTINNYYSGPDTTKCHIIVRAKITQTIKTR